MKTERGLQVPKKRATVVDVARAARVSPGTVSNAISGKRRVDSETRARIDQAIRELGYVPNLAARGMRTGRASTIAIFSSMPTAVAAGPSKLGFLMEIAASAAQTALEQNFALVLIPPIQDPGEALANIAFDGAILVEPDANDAALVTLRARGVPVVIIGPADLGPDVRGVMFDYAAMADLLIGHLIEKGARDFPLIVGQSGRASNRVFRDRYTSLVSRAGLEPRVIAVPERDAEAGARAAIDAEFAAGRVMDGLLVPIDAMATGAMTALRQRGLRVPEDVRVATRYDGIRARTENPALTALDLRLEETARLATLSLIGALEVKDEGEILNAPPPRLVARASTA